MEDVEPPTFRPTVTVWPAEPPDLPGAVVRPLRRPNPDGVEFGSWNPAPNPDATVTLPEDFCLREVRATDPDDLEAVYDFVTHWGRLSPPDAHLRPPLDPLPASLDRLVPQLADPTLRAPLAQIETRSTDHEALATLPHSLHAEAHHLRVLRALVGHTLASDAGASPAAAWAAEGFEVGPGEPWGIYVVTMNAALRPFSVHVRYPGAEALLDTPGTYEVAVLQLSKHIAEHRHARVCANERCKRLFTRQRGRAQFENTGHSTGVIYCSNLCAKAQAERVRRARKRAEENAQHQTTIAGAD